MGEYYFSPINMNQDEYLRENMDKNGWVLIDILLGFNRMKVLNATKELVIEAAFHSQLIEIDTKNQNKVRMTKLWKQYIADKAKKDKKEKEKAKAKEKRRRDREREKELEKKLDAAEVNELTIEAIVAGIEKKQEKRKKRGQQREREKEKEKA